MKPGRVGCAGLLRWRGDDLDSTVTRLKTAGADWGREDFQWNRVEVERGRYDWTHLDRMMTATARNRMRIIAIPNSPPRWHQNPTLASPHQTPPVAGEALRDYISFLDACIRRYGSLGTFWAIHPELPRVPVTHWDIWNEPYYANSWATGPNAVEYGTFFANVVGQVRLLDEHARFMLETAPRMSWIDAIAQRTSALDHADALSVHPYCGAESPYTRGGPVQRLVRLHERFPKKAIWITEIGWPTSGYYSVDEETQARYVHELFEAVRSLGFVRGLVYYTYWTYGLFPNDREHWFGLVRCDYTAKPAWDAFTEEAHRGFEYR